MNERQGMKVRRLGTGVVHAVDAVLPTVAAKWIGPAFHAVETPLVARCGAVLRDERGILVVMRPDVRLSCRTCARLGRYPGTASDWWWETARTPSTTTAGSESRDHRRH
jgi:hypothetical protein